MQWTNDFRRTVITFFLEIGHGLESLNTLESFLFFYASYLAGEFEKEMLALEQGSSNSKTKTLNPSLKKLQKQLEVDSLVPLYEEILFISKIPFRQSIALSLLMHSVCGFTRLF